MFVVEILEICQLILMSKYFSTVFLGSSLSNRGAKSKNEFAATEKQCSKGVGHVTKKFEECVFMLELKNRKFCLDILFLSVLFGIIKLKCLLETISCLY